MTANYYKRFNATTAVIEKQWGFFFPDKLAARSVLPAEEGQEATSSDDDKKEARDAILSMIFLAGADKKRFGKLTEELNNSYLAQKDNYPRMLESMLTLLSHYQDHRGSAKSVGGNEGSTETSFAQSRGGGK